MRILTTRAPRTERRGASARAMAFAATGAVTLALAACSSSDPEPSASAASSDTQQEPVTIEFWGWLDGLEDAVALFNETHDDIQVDFQQIASADLEKLSAAIDSGTAPDAVQVGSHQLADYVVNQQIADISAYVSDAEDDFSASSWSSVAVGGGDAVYGVPQDSAPYGYLYRTDIFEEYGLTVPTTWDEWVDTARQLHEANPDIYLAQFSPGDPAQWYSTVLQNGGSYFGIDGDSWTVEVNNEASQEVAVLWQEMLDEDLFKVVEMWTPEYWAEINAGTIASINAAAWFPSVLEGSAPELTGQWAVAPSPTFTGSDAVPDSGGSVNAVPISSEHPAEAAEFLVWLNSDPASLEILVDQGGIFPSAKAGLELEALSAPKEYFGGQSIGEVFIESASDVPNTWVDGPAHEAVQTLLKDNFARVASGEITFLEALDLVAEDTKQVLVDKGLSVK